MALAGRFCSRDAKIIVPISSLGCGVGQIHHKAVGESGHIETRTNSEEPVPAVDHGNRDYDMPLLVIVITIPNLARASGCDQPCSQPQ